jgi:excinuclease UvrABC nuclease subunit
MADYQYFIPGVKAKEAPPRRATKQDLPGIGPEIANALKNAGFTSIDKIKQASDKELLAISGINTARLKTIRAALSEV